VDRSLQLIRDHGCRAGLVFNPATPLSWLDHVMDRLDIILLMSVNPGFGGQSLIASTLPKITQVRARIAAHRAAGGQPIWLEVDGGIKVDNIAAVAAAGADTFVAGSAIFGAPDSQGGYQGVLQAFRGALAPAGSGSHSAHAGAVAGSPAP
jgi:ribulose-phosphate 3-epimerase